MHKKLRNLEITGFFINSALAVVFHFLYEWLPYPLTAAIAPVNESIWEHIKIIFFPYLLWCILEFMICKPQNVQAFIYSKAYSLVLLPIMLVIFNYTYSGIIGRNIIFIDISNTFIYLLIAFMVSYKSYEKRWRKFAGAAEIAALFFITALIVFTFAPPHIPLFFDFAAAVYGIT